MQVTMGSDCTRPTPRKSLERQKEGLEKQLARINEAIAILDKNPEFEQAFTALQQAL